jgi:hypothetical protein
MAALLADGSGPALEFAALAAEIRLLAPLSPPTLPRRLQATLGSVAVAHRRLLAAGRLNDPDDLVASLRLGRLGAPPVDIGRSD